MTIYALNGLGRIGKLALKPLLERGAEIAWINDAVGDPAMHAHLLEFDTVHGRWDADFAHDADSVTIDGTRLPFIGAAGSRGSAARWRRCGDRLHRRLQDRRRRSRPYFEAGVKKVVVSAPVKDGDAANIVYGVNHDIYDPARHRIVTAASCTTNCLAPVVKVIHEAIGIRHGSITTIHDVTNTQTIVDRPAKDLRRARSALNSLIPTTTGSATAITLIYPELKGRLNGHAVRVPLLNASLTDCVFEVERETDRRRGQRAVQGRGRGAAQGHPRLRGAPAGLGRLHQRHAVRHRRRALDHGGERHAGEDLCLVRQRDGLCAPAGRRGADGRGIACDRTRARRVCPPISRSPPPIGPSCSPTARSGCWCCCISTRSASRRSSSPICSCSTRSRGWSRTCPPGWIAARFGLTSTLYAGLALQVVALIALAQLDPAWAIGALGGLCHGRAGRVAAWPRIWPRCPRNPR